MRPHRARRHRGFVNQAIHFGREFGHHADVFFRTMGPALRTVAMGAAPALASAGMPQAAAATAVLGQAAGGILSFARNLKAGEQDIRNLIPYVPVDPPARHRCAAEFTHDSGLALM